MKNKEIIEKDNNSNEIKSDSKKYFEVNVKKNDDINQNNHNNNEIIGPTTRRKEQEKLINNGKNNYPLLRKWDEYFKDSKNSDNLIFIYKPPRIDKKNCQVNFDELKEKKDLKIKLNKKYDFSKISKEDLDYYLKFIHYYQNQINLENMYLKGVHSPEARALDLLKECNYNINETMEKILFPVMDRMSCLDNCKKDKFLFLSSALHDLIGANEKEKEEWLIYINNRLNSTIEKKELEKLIDIGKKMKVEIPFNVQREMKSAFTFSKMIKGCLSNKNNTLNDINQLYEISKTFKVQTEDFENTGELIKRAKLFEKKIYDIHNQTVPYKNLQTLYHEGKNLPFKFEGDLYIELKKRFESAQEWHRIYSCLPKHSKTRAQNLNNQCERSSLNFLGKMIETAHKVNFTSNEVETLEKTYKLLCEEEEKIKKILNDNSINKTRELLQDFKNTLDSLRFTTDLYEVVENKLALIEWNEKKEEFLKDNNIKDVNKRNKVVKPKFLKNLIKFSEQRNLSNIPEIKNFIEQYNIMNSWVEKLTPIFNEVNSNKNSKNESEEEEEEKSEKKIKNQENNSISYDELLNYFNEGKNFEYINEDCKFLLEKCEEIIKLHNEIDSVIQSNSNYDYEKFSIFCEEINQYKVKCKEFDFIINQINIVQKWLNDTKEFITKYNYLKKNKFKLDKNCNIECRNSNIKILDNYLKDNFVFYENLSNLTINIPKFAKNTNEYKELNEIQLIAEKNLNIKIDNLNSIEEIINLLENIQDKCISKKIFIQVMNLYKTTSLISISKTNEKMTLNEAEDVYKGLEEINKKGENNINFDIDNFKKGISKTKEWIRLKKKLLNSDKISYKELNNLINDGKNLPYQTNEIKECIEFKESIDDDIKKIEETFNHSEEKNAEEIEELYKNIDKRIIDNTTLNFLKKTHEAINEWSNIANLVINSRKLVQLYFKKPSNENNNFNNNNINDNNIINISNNINSKTTNFINTNISNNINNNINNENINNNTNNINLININTNNKDNINNNIKNINHIQIDNNINNNNINNNILNYNENEKPKIEIHLKSDIPIDEEIENFQTPNNKINKISTPKKDKTEIENIENLIEKKSTLDINDFLGKKRQSNKEKINNSPNLNNEKINESNLEYAYNYFYSQPLTLNECENLLSLLNTIIPNPNKILSNGTQKLTAMEKNAIKNFQNLSYEERYNILNQKLILKYDTGEKFCICRQGDDSVNYMIMCENCKEWFHGKCINLSKNEADNIKDYICLCCSRRKGNYNIQCNNNFFQKKRITYYELNNLIDNGKSYGFIFWQMKILLFIKEQCEKWIQRYCKILEEIINYYKEGKIFLNEDFDKKLRVLYLESEGFCVEIPSSYNTVVILRQSDWFKEINNLSLKNNKISKNEKKLLTNSYSLFDLEFKNQVLVLDIEKEYFTFIYEKAAKILSEMKI